tara:strand:+ start:165 stop:959 length:795 start_codon:yes stop_codon:yes gene_type:complete
MTMMMMTTMGRRRAANAFLRKTTTTTRLNEMASSSSSSSSSSSPPSTLPLTEKEKKTLTTTTTTRAAYSTTTRERDTVDTSSSNNNNKTTKKAFSTGSARLRIGHKGIPDEYGQPKTGGTSFLGTPENHRELLSARPLSPDVLDVDGKSAHYKFPIVALSSITNRITGCVLSGAVGVGGVIACVGGPEAVPETVEMFKTQFPMLVFPVKAALSFPFVYHGVAGMRHLVWDMSAFGIDNENAKKSSMFVFASSVVGAAAMASSSF